MDVAITLERMPFGEYLGTPAIRLEMTGEPKPIAVSPLATALERYRGPGVRCLHLARVPWAAPWWPDFLAELQESLWTMITVGVLRLEEIQWVSADVHWTMDASVLFDPATYEEGGSLAAVLEHVGHFPRTEDLIAIVADDHASMVLPTSLDGIYGHMMPGRQAQLVVTRATAERVLPIVARANTPWTIVVP